MGTRSFLIGIGVGMGVAIGAIPILGIVGRFMAGEFPRPCVNEIKQEFPSPNGRSVAIVVLARCDATQPNATSVAVKRAGEKFDFDNYDAYLFIVRDENKIEVSWDKDKYGITILHERPTRINRKVVVDRMMPISYREKQ
jgi:hypothetical protein